MRKSSVDGLFQATYMLVLLCLYALTGAVIFQLMEQPTEVHLAQKHKEAIESARAGAMKIWTGNSSKEEANRSLELLHDAIFLARRQGFQLKGEPSTSKWGLVTSVFFAATSLMTIGYGNMVPRTNIGKIFCIIFSMIGIPFTILVIGEWGILTSNAIRWCFKKQKSRKKIIAVKNEYRKSFWVVITTLITFGYVLAGSAMLLLWEDWTFFEAFYFCFITMTTIGLGDLVPGNEKYLLLCAVYVLLGMALFSALFGYLQKEYSKGWRNVRKLSLHIQAIVNPLTLATLKLNERLRPESQEASAVLSLLRELEAFKEHLRLIMMQAGETANETETPEPYQIQRKASTVSSDSSIWYMEWDRSWEKRWEIFRENHSIHPGREKQNDVKRY